MPVSAAKMDAGTALCRRSASTFAKIRLPRCRIRNTLAVEIELFHN